MTHEAVGWLSCLHDVCLVGSVAGAESSEGVNSLQLPGPLSMQPVHGTQPFSHLSVPLETEVGMLPCPLTAGHRAAWTCCLLTCQSVTCDLS